MIHRLHVEKGPSLWVVSKVLVERDGGRIIINAFDATPAQIVEKLAVKTNSTIIRDILPSTPLSIHLENESIHEIVTLIMKPFSEYTVTLEGS
jgi:general secretion pathway protein D/type IV pilus assembly protein PilQ